MSAFLFFLIQKLFEKKTVSECVVLMNNSKIDMNAMKSAKISLNELMSRARQAGYFNLGDIDIAIMETNGELSFLPMPMKRPLNPKDFNFAPVREGMSRVVIKNGRILKNNLEKSQISQSALFQLLSKRGESVSDILLATVNEAGRVDFFSSLDK